jgi:hypothetical protein
MNNEDMSNKLEEYKHKLNQNLLNKLAEEREKEDEREKALKHATDEDEKSRLEKQFGEERAEASNRIVKLNE